MKKWWKHFLLVLVLFTLPLLAVNYNGADAIRGITWGFTKAGTARPPISIHKLKVNYGVYDHGGRFKDAKGVAFEQFYYKWNEYNSAQVNSDMQHASERNRWPLITIEPYPFQTDTQAINHLFDDILKGRYDEPIRKFHDDLVQFGKPVFLRWGHEMEKVTGRYPWAQDDYEGYISAYRYFCEKIKSPQIEAYFVWSPVGNQEMFKYWPGAEYVDYVGVSVYGFPDWELDHGGKLRTFKDLFREKYQRAVVFGKPVMIAELGITGESSYQAQWMYDAFRSFKSFPKLNTVVYFNAKDSELAWDRKYRIPDWHIDSTLFDRYEFSGTFD